MVQRKTNVLREKCDVEPVCPEVQMRFVVNTVVLGQVFPYQYCSITAPDQFSSTAGLSKTGCRPNPKYNLTSWVIVCQTVPHQFFIFTYFYVTTCKTVLIYNFAGFLECTMK
jgi:hypothetical protein